MGTQDWGNLEQAKVLVIGHDPRLQNSNTIAEYCFFADYYFKAKPTKPNELSKYQLAKSTFEYIQDITNNVYNDKDIYLTNLCNDELEHAPKKKTVLIPEDKAKEGLQHIRQILSQSHIECIFSMSLQVNYWLQKLGFYYSTETFLIYSEPQKAGLIGKEKYYTPKKTRTFLEICGNKYLADNQYPLFPILHVKVYPLKGRFMTYADNYKRLKDFFHKDYVL